MDGLVEKTSIVTINNIVDALNIAYHTTAENIEK